jgi:lipopolysaccharide heptosyltransferase II
MSPRILVIKLSAIGDAILAVPSFKALKKKFPTSYIVCLAGKEARDIFARCPYIDELIVCDFKDKDRGLKGLFRVARRIFRRRFDFCVDFQNNKMSHLLGYATGAGRRYGYDNGKASFLINKKIKDDGAAMDPVAHQFRVLGMLGISYAGETLELWPSEEDKAVAVRLLRDQGWKNEPLVGLNIGASPRWLSKRWPVRHIVELCEILEARGVRVVLTGSSADAAAAEKVLKRMKARPYCVVARTTLMQLAALIRSCDVYVTGDSAPMHMAAAMQIPLVALFGPTEANRHLAPSEASLVLQKGCSACYKDVCRKKTHVCMEEILPQDVVEAVERLIRVKK